MQQSERDWQSCYTDHRNMYSQSMVTLQEVDSVPAIYGRKNQRYISPTFRSNPILYGEQEVRDKPRQTFTTVNEAFMGSPLQKQSYKEKMDMLKCQSTNRYAPYQNGFHKSTNGQLNYKNYSEIPLGFNNNIKDTYEKQFYNRSKACEMKFGTSQGGIVYNIQDQNTKQNYQKQCDDIPNKNNEFNKRHLRSSEISPQIQNYPQKNRFNSPMSQRFTQDQFYSKSPLSERGTYNEPLPVQFRKNNQRLLSPQPQKKQVNFAEAQDDVISLKSQNYQDQQVSPSKPVKIQIVKDEPYEAPDWCFFSPQMDPFKKAFETKQLTRVNSVDRVWRDKQNFEFSNAKKVDRKRVLQEGSVSPNGDNFVQTFQGDTLKWSHTVLENTLEKRKHLITQKNSQNYNQSAFSKSVLQNAYQEQQKTSNKNEVFSMLGFNDKDKLYQDKQYHKHVIQQQIQQSLSNKKQERHQRIEQEQQIINGVLFATQQVNQMNFLHKNSVREDLQQFYQDRVLLQQREKYHQMNDRQKHKTMIDQGFLRGQQKENDHQLMQKELQKQLAQSYKEHIDLKHHKQQQYGRNYQPITQRLLNFQNPNFTHKPHAQSISYINNNNLKTLDNYHSVSNLQHPRLQEQQDRQPMIQSYRQVNSRPQIDVQDMDANAMNYSFVSSQANFGQCLSNASTVSSCSLQQVTKAEISKAEFELRKKQVQHRKNHVKTNQKLKAYSKQSPKKNAAKFTVRSNQVENQRIYQ
eukprot:403347050